MTTFFEYVRRIVIAESAKTPNDADRLGYALFVENGHYSYTILLNPTKIDAAYDEVMSRKPAQYASKESSWMRAANDVDWKSSVIAMVSRRLSLESVKHASVISSSAAENGFGPLLYDYVLSKGWVTPDKISVSDSAKQIWNYYYANRKDVEKKRIANYEPSDELAEFEAGKYQYKRQDDGSHDSLIERGEELLDKWSFGDEGAKKKMLKLIRLGADEYFTERYGEN